MLPSVLNHATGGKFMPSQPGSAFQEVACSQKQASSRKPAAITPGEKQSERYFIDLPTPHSPEEFPHEHEQSRLGPFT
jgi:hypothetical protein